MRFSGHVSTAILAAARLAVGFMVLCAAGYGLFVDRASSVSAVPAGAKCLLVGTVAGRDEARGIYLLRDPTGFARCRTGRGVPSLGSLVITRAQRTDDADDTHECDELWRAGTY